MSNNFIEMITVLPMDLGAITLKAEQKVLVNIDDDKVILKIDSNGFEISISKKYIERTTCLKFDDLFVSIDEISNVTTYGSELKLITNKGLVTYTVESISFKNDGIAYATLNLKIS